MRFQQPGINNNMTLFITYSACLTHNSMNRYWQHSCLSCNLLFVLILGPSRHEAMLRPVGQAVASGSPG